MEKEKEKKCEKCEEYLNGWKRERADFINYKKDEMERIGSLIKYSTEELLLKVLPILDHFNIAELHLTGEDKKNSHISGLLQIKQQMEEFLKSSGVEEVKAEIGNKFDPNIHEALEEVVAKDKESGIIIDVVSKGYVSNGHLLRPSKVKISK
jgi:molecular chaperone GrpE